jgi:hypothetical protein
VLLSSRPLIERALIITISAMGALAIVLGVASMIYTLVSLLPRLDRAYDSFTRDIALVRGSVDAVLEDRELRGSLARAPQDAAQTANRAADLTEDMTGLAVRTGDVLRTTAKLLSKVGGPAEAVAEGEPVRDLSMSLENLAISAEELSKTTPALRRELEQMGARFSGLSAIAERALAPEGPALGALGDNLAETHDALFDARLPQEVAAMVIGLSGLSIIFGLAMIALAATSANASSALRLLER